MKWFNLIVRFSLLLFACVAPIYSVDAFAVVERGIALLLYLYYLRWIDSYADVLPITKNMEWRGGIGQLIVMFIAAILVWIRGSDELGVATIGLLGLFYIMFLIISLIGMVYRIRSIYPSA